MVEPVQSSSLAGYAGYLHDGLPHRQGLCPSPLVHLFLSSTSVSGGAAEVDEEEHCEVQPALLLHVHEDRQLSSEEEVSGSAGNFLIKLVVLYSQIQHLVDAGLMRDDELKVLQDLDTKVFQSVPHKSRIFPIKIIPFFQRPHNKI